MPSWCDRYTQIRLHVAACDPPRAHRRHRCCRVLFASRDLSSSVLVPVVSDGGRDLYAIHPVEDLPVHTDHEYVRVPRPNRQAPVQRC